MGTFYERTKSLIKDEQRNKERKKEDKKTYFSKVNKFSVSLGLCVKMKIRDSPRLDKMGSEENEGREVLPSRGNKRQHLPNRERIIY